MTSRALVRAAPCALFVGSSGVEAFGINWFELPPGAEGKEHDEMACGQEEVSVVVRGSGRWRVDGSEVYSFRP
jgi:uncharacterized cupin superfamily protein